MIRSTHVCWCRQLNGRRRWEERLGQEACEGWDRGSNLQDSTSSPGDGVRRVRDTEDEFCWDMGRGRLSRGLLLRLGVLLTAACVCLHVYLETGWREEAPAGRPSHGRAQQNQGRTKQVSAEAARQDRSVKRRVSYVQTGKRENPARRREREREDSSPCCPRRKSRWHITLEPWAAESRSLEDEAKRFLTYITTPQLLCSALAGKEGSPQGGSERAWDVCLDPKYSLAHRMESKRCRVYSFGLGMDDRSLERFLARSGCEVHCFNPSLKLPHLQQGEMWLHRLSVDWRDPNPAAAAQRQHANTKKLAAILNDFGHRQVDVLKADVESAEWKILENLILEGVLDSVGQLLLELHLHWPGFEVAGDDPSVVRYWFSLLKELERANFRLFRVYSDPGRPHLFLHKNVFNASSAYTLSWVKVDWMP